MKTKDYILSALSVIVIAVAVVFFVRWNNERRDRIQMENLLSTAINQYETIITNKGQEINIQAQTIATLENVLAAGILEKEELKEKNLKYISHILKLENKIVFYEELIATMDTSSTVVEVTDTCPEIDPGTYLKVPAKFIYADEWVSFAGTIYGSTVGMRDLTITQKPTILLGYQKAGWFKPLKPVVTVEDANPYVHTVAMNNVKIYKKPPFYKRPWWHRMEGAALVIGAQVALNYAKQ